MRRAVRRGWCARPRAAGILALLVFSFLPASTRAKSIDFRLFNLGQTTAYVVLRNSSKVSTEATTPDGVFAERIDAATGDQIVLSPNTNLAPPVPPLFNAVTSSGPTCARLEWSASSDPSVVGYRVSYGVMSVEDGQTTDYQYYVDLGPITTYDACSLANSTYYFAVQAVNYAGQLSAFSVERSVESVTSAVLISRFDARAQRNGVRLSWEIERDEAISGFVVYRRTAGGIERRMTATPLPVDATSYLDSSVRSGTTYTYVLAAVRDDAPEIRSAPAQATTPSLVLALDPNLPNPFRGATRIPFTLDQATRVTVRVYDVAGALVATIFDGYLPEGAHEVGWGGHDNTGHSVASGAYFCALTAGKATLSRKMLLVR